MALKRAIARVPIPLAQIKSFLFAPTKAGRYRRLMQKTGGTFALTATDLVGYLNCRRLSELDRAVAEGRLAKPKVYDPLLEI